MTRLITRALAATILAAGLAASAQAQAQAQDAAAPPAETPFVTLSGTAAFVSDYRFRGVSLSDRDIAGQASLTATTAPGIFLGIWGSTIQPIGATFDAAGNETNNGAEQEIDLTGGFSKTFGPVTPTIGMIGYVYPGGKGVEYYEVFGSVAGNLGPAALTFGMNYAPKQDNTGHNDNLYIFGLAAVAIPNTPFTVKGSVGRENGAFDFGSSSKIDYMGGVDFKYKFITLGVQYVGNDLSDRIRNSSPTFHHDSKGGVVFSITAAF